MGNRNWMAARRWVISGFVVAHLSAMVLWVMPPCPLRTRCFAAVSYYVVPLGLWQYWGMFAPDPPKNVLALGAEAIDVHGVRYNFAFAKQTDYSAWSAIPRHRHPKFAMNLLGEDPEHDVKRLFAARHVVRQLDVPADAFPVDVRLVFQVTPCPPPGSPPGTEPGDTQAVSIGAFRFHTLGEVRP